MRGGAEGLTTSRRERIGCCGHLAAQFAPVEFALSLFLAAYPGAEALGRAHIATASGETLGARTIVAAGGGVGRTQAFPGDTHGVAHESEDPVECAPVRSMISECTAKLACQPEIKSRHGSAGGVASAFHVVGRW